MDEVPLSVLDTDLYKLTMQQAILQHFPEAEVTYQFTNRSKDMRFTREYVDMAWAHILRLENMHLTPAEHAWLSEACPYFTPSYLSTLLALRLDPSSQVTLTYVPSDDDPNYGQIELEIRGLWWQTILYEVPIMAVISDAYFRVVDQDWSYAGQEDKAYEKGKTLLSHGIAFSEFGTRRRRSYPAQKTIMHGLIRARDELEGKPGMGSLSGTSNVHFAMMFGLTPVGTIAHEWTMGIASLLGYEHANAHALDLWEDTYPTSPSNALHIGLTDTFSSEVFFRDFLADPARARRWRGLRQDSGSPEEYTKRAKQVYDQMGVDSRTKNIIYSDGLDVPRCLVLQKVAQDIGFIPAFGIGTSLTNDFVRLSDGKKSRPLNMVIKLHSINGVPCVKISDEITKNTGDAQAVKDVKELLGLPVNGKPNGKQ
ncbi:nicotinate phosphoribosyltransferase [Dacryopinax primogenitus]|uniref:Nicotinate phosphoribosyltransferase n=1 Tax=Dacryopinax primogenitus (strain DJM 731) TaxID=1858805 RepID=M5G7J8_DACPD|nr:nicotinate phosphoribosyltransferase [Dacryopinax primogenitus]EJU04699.1 nicotinate phosphoribosyltransferase [Dacryopinax primogenitus]